ncbi:DUF6049 family protein [Sphaerisporangium fuscum]|uniref:DUF6049 family protein n=1 Tax=Sphaerisporangium fuscum TaxID=2835868 RepID=UPI001BDCD5E9|nr:DUF6049 family protein [Sphaerisporangium fuscum]
MIRGAALISVLTAAFLVPAAVAGAESASATGIVAGAGSAPAAGAVQAAKGTSAARAKGTARTASARQDPQVVINSITPQAPTDPSTPMKISGYLSVTGGTQLTAPLTIRMRFSRQPFAGRAEMQAFADGGTILDQARQTIPVTQLTPGKTPWEFPTTPLSLGMSRFGVYPLTVELIDGTGRQVSAQRTFLPYAPKNQPVTRTRIAWAFPIVDQPHRGDDTTFVDDGLRDTVADDGRLGRILKIAETPSKGMNWFLDPAVLDDAQVMAKGYSLKTGTGTTSKPADQDVAQWLQRLRTALADADVIATPYADPDVTAISHNGLDSATGIALKKGEDVATEILGKSVGTGTNWPAGGVIDYDGLDTLAVNDVRTVLLSSTALPPNPPLPTTSDAAASLDSVQRKMKVLLADPVLSQLLNTNGASAPDATLATQRFLAETAMISAEPVQESRAVIAAAPRRWNPDPAFVTSLLKAASSAPWLKPVSLGSIKPKAPATPRSDLLYTDKDRQAELSRSYLSGVRKLGIRADLTATVTKDHRRVFDAAVLRLTSTAWRGRTGSAGPLVKQVDSAVAARTNTISVNTVEDRNIAGKNGVVPISIRNGLPDQDATVGVRITSGDKKVLTIGSYETPVTISAGKTTTIDIPMIINRGGQTTVKVQLTTANGVRYGNAVQVTVKTTGYTAIALVIVGGALTVMLAAVALRLLRRRSRRLAKSRKAAQTGPHPVPEPARHREGPS